MVTYFIDTIVESRTSVVHQSAPGMVVSRILQGTVEEIFISAWKMEGENTEDVFRRVARIACDRNVTVVSQQVFGFSASAGGIKSLQEMMGDVEWPVTWLEGSPESTCSGMEIWAVRSARVKTIRLNDVVVGSFFDRGEYRICRLGGLFASDGTLDPGGQTRAVFELMEEGLESAGMDFGDVIRTWFHNRDILSWYRDFNSQRTHYFNEKRVFDGIIPASTGVSGMNTHGAALTAGLLAFKTTKPSVIKVEALPSPLQCPAMHYGSSFSRAVSVHCPGHQRVFVSGTASIGSDGKIMFSGDIAGQVYQTIEVIHAILKQKDLSWHDAVRAIAYVKKTEHVEISKNILEATGLTDFPVIFTQTDLCYEDLLFEMEVDAIGPMRVTE
jgi:enamine deaminase RidA (YjgF/YER057c/UK114 family)